MKMHSTTKSTKEENESVESKIASPTRICCQTFFFVFFMAQFLNYVLLRINGVTLA